MVSMMVSVFSKFDGLQNSLSVLGLVQQLSHVRLNVLAGCMAHGFSGGLFCILLYFCSLCTLSLKMLLLPAREKEKGITLPGTLLGRWLHGSVKVEWYAYVSTAHELYSYVLGLCYPILLLQCAVSWVNLIKYLVVWWFS